MKSFRIIVVLFLVSGVLFTLLSSSPASSPGGASDIEITDWSIQWISGGEPESQHPDAVAPWHPANLDNPLADIPAEADGVWVHLVLPPTSQWAYPGVFIQRMYGLDITVYKDSRPVYQSERDFDFERNNLLIPVTAHTEPADLYIRITSKERAGISSAIHVGEYNALSNQFIRNELPNLLLGASIAFMAIMTLICSRYLHKAQKGPSIALGLFALSASTLIITYSSLPYYYFQEYGHLLLFLFDTSMYVLFPSLLFFVIRISEGTHVLITRLEQWLHGYYAFCFIIMVLYKWFGEPLYFYYKLFTYWILAPFILIQLILIIVLSFQNAVRGNRNSIILASGLLMLALSGVADLVLFYISDGRHLLILWKWGFLILIASLIIILNRRIAVDYQKLLSYSKELEIYNHQLQKTEKMQIISELAASIAHEIRNPLQVTRGFLQLLSGKSDAVAKPHFTIAINELDRASAIITDFLTFAKPEMDTIEPMDLQQELNKIEKIMSPLAMMNGGVVCVSAAENLSILGNPSKFKQALINMVKNSIEAMGEEGKIEIEAFAEEETAVIRITDNGEGMDEEQIAKLGEPFFSTKTKGTGLGLMVTFRIIEVMKGSLEFRSNKGKGTEAIVRFPLIQSD